MADKYAGLMFKLAANATQLVTGVNQAKRSIYGLQKTAMQLKGALIGAFAARAVLNGVKNLSRTFTEFEQSMANVKAITRATGDEFIRLKQLSKDLGASTKFTASEVSELEVAYGKLGFSVKEIEGAAEATLNLAAATGEELGRAAEVAGGVVRGFQLDAKETTRVTDVMARSFTASALDMEKFAESMKYVAPIANVTGTSLEETSAYLSVLADNMIDGSMAGTGMRNIFNELTKNGRPLNETLHDLAESGLSLAEAEELVGKRAMTALIVLTKNIEKADKLTDAYNRAGGAAERMANIQLETLKGKTIILNSAMDGLKITIGELATESGFFGDGLEQITEFITRLNKILPQFNSLLGKTNFKLMDFATGIAGAPAAAAGRQIRGRIKSKYSSWQSRRNTTGYSPTALSSSFAGAIPRGGNIQAQGALSSFNQMPGEKRFGLSGMSGMSDFGAMSGGDAMATISGVLSSDTMSKYHDDIKRITEASKELVGINKDLGESLLDIQRNYITVGEVISDVVQNSIVAAIDIMGGAIETAFSTGNIENVFQDVMRSFGSFLKQMGAMFVAYGVANSAFIQALKNPTNPANAALLIGAGITMIALGSAITGAASGWASRSGGGGGGVSQGGGYSATDTRAVTVEIDGQLKGSDIYWSNKNYSTSLNS